MLSFFFSTLIKTLITTPLLYWVLFIAALYGVRVVDVFMLFCLIGHKHLDYIFLFIVKTHSEAQYSTQHVPFHQNLLLQNLTLGQPFTQSGLQVAPCSPLLIIPCPFYQDKRGQGHWQNGALGLHAGFQAWRTIRGWCWRDPWDPPPLPHIHPCPSFQHQHGAKTLCGLFRHRLRSCSVIPQGCTLCVW